MNGEILEKMYLEKLEERIIYFFHQKTNKSYEEAMKLYYNSRLAKLIQTGKYDIQYLDYKVLTQMLFEEYGIIE
ncbi:MAG: hypothetical protein MJ097_05815 [Dorea sp.]|nr:hypothetical protein [Dorea sp.]